MSRNRGPVLDDRAVEQVLGGSAGPLGPDLQPALALMRSLADGPPPRPTAALADLLDRGFEPAPVRLRRPAARGRAWTARASGVLTAAAASLLVAAAAAQVLPPALHNGIADLVSMLTPFELPRSQPTQPDPASGPTPAGDGAPTETPQGPSPSSTPAAPTHGRSQDEQVDTSADLSTTERAERDRRRAAEEAAEESQRAARAAEDAAKDRADEAKDRADEAKDRADEAKDEADETEDRQEDSTEEARHNRKEADDRDD